MRNFLPFCNAFDAALNLLEARCNGDPSRLALLVPNDEEVRKTTGWIYFETGYFELIRSQKRYIEGIPSWFIKRFAEYQEHWGAAVERSYGPLSLDFLLSDFEGAKGCSPDEIHHSLSSHLKDHVRHYLEFAPGGQHGAKAIEGVMDHEYDGIDEDGEDAAGNDMRFMLEGIEAWEFFQKEVQIDFNGIEKRWQKLPRALIPHQLQKASSNLPYAGVVGLLNDAISAYLAGALAASVITCRTILEQLLKSAYVPHMLPKGGPEPSLEEVISMALQEPNYRWVWPLNLHSLRKFANSVVHKPSKARWGEDADTQTVKFLQVIAVLIEKAPPVR